MYVEQGLEEGKASGQQNGSAIIPSAFTGPIMLASTIVIPLQTNPNSLLSLHRANVAYCCLELIDLDTLIDVKVNHLLINLLRCHAVVTDQTDARVASRLQSP